MKCGFLGSFPDLSSESNLLLGKSDRVRIEIDGGLT